MKKRDRSVVRMWVLAPPHRLLGGTTRLSESTVVGYATLGDGGALSYGEAPIAQMPRCARVDIVVDGADVFQTTVAAPRLADGKLRLALPSLLEDRLLSDPADCHFAFQPVGRGAGATTSPQPLPVAVVDRAMLTRLRDVLEAAGARARAAYSAIYLLPAPSGGTLSVHAARGRVVARTAAHDGIACEFDGTEPPATLLLALRSGGWQRIRAYGPQAMQMAGIGEALGVPVDLADKVLDVEATAGAINLLQGAFSRGGLFDLASQRWSARAWKAPLIWGLVAAGVFLVGMNAYWLKLRSESDQLRGRMTQAFRSAFPEAELVDPVIQTQRELVRLRARAGRSSPGDFTALNAQVAQLFAGAPVGITSAVEYRSGTLQLRFKSPPDAQLQNSLRAQAVQQGLQLRFAADGTATVAAVGG